MPNRHPATGSTKLSVESVATTILQYHPKNVRLHDERNIQAIARSLETYGQRTPIVINASNHVLKGNGTLEAALRLGWESIEVVQVTHLSPEEELAYMLVDNKTGDLSEFDLEGLASAFHELESMGFELDATGFSDFEYQPLMSADFTPPDPGAEPKNTSRLVFTEEDFATLEKAGNLWNSVNGEELRLADCLVSIASSYIRQNRVKVKRRKQ